MSFCTPPLITSTEVTLGLPTSQNLWQASSARAWRDAYLLQNDDASGRLPNIAACMNDAHAMLRVSGQIDIPFSENIILGTLWRQIWNSRQLSASFQKSDTTGLFPNLGLASCHWQQDFVRAIQHFRMAISDLKPRSGPAALAHEHLLLNIFVSFEELSRFSGKEGTSEARRAFPVLRQWARGTDSRQAVWHAGQIIGVVVAETYEAAREAAHAVRVRYDAEPPAATFDSPGAVAERREPGEHKDFAIGDVHAALALAPVRIDARYGTPTQHHNPIELFSTTAAWHDGSLTVYEPSQFVHGLRGALAKQLHLDIARIRVVSRHVGGAFGSKGIPSARTAWIAVAARVCERAA